MKPYLADAIKKHFNAFNIRRAANKIFNRFHHKAEKVEKVVQKRKPSEKVFDFSLRQE
ncbi:MAG: hypothetical protein Q8P13_03200 [bacterium]|nr:hypothetical protein [bacterium]